MKAFAVLNHTLYLTVELSALPKFQVDGRLSVPGARVEYFLGGMFVPEASAIVAHAESLLA